MVKMQAAEVPFVIRGAPDLNGILEKWTHEYLSKKLGMGKDIKASTSKGSRHMYISGINMKKVDSPPVEVSAVTLKELLQKQTTELKLNASSTYGLIDSANHPFIQRDLRPVMKRMGWNRFV